MEALDAASLTVADRRELTEICPGLSPTGVPGVRKDSITGAGFQLPWASADLRVQRQELLDLLGQRSPDRAAIDRVLVAIGAAQLTVQRVVADHDR